MIEERERVSAELLTKAKLMYATIQGLTEGPAEWAYILTIVHCLLLANCAVDRIDNELSMHVADVKFNMYNVRSRQLQ